MRGNADLEDSSVTSALSSRRRRRRRIRFQTYSGIDSASFPLKDGRGAEGAPGEEIAE